MIFASSIALGENLPANSNIQDTGMYTHTDALLSLTSSSSQLLAERGDPGDPSDPGNPRSGSHDLGLGLLQSCSLDIESRLVDWRHHCLGGEELQ